MKRFLLSVALIGLSVPAMAELREARIGLACMKNQDDGRILIEDGRQLPGTAQTFSDGDSYKIKKFIPVNSDGTWTHGLCDVRYMVKVQKIVYRYAAPNYSGGYNCAAVYCGGSILPLTGHSGGVAGGW